MSDLMKYVAKRKKRNQEFAEGFDLGYARFKIGTKKIVSVKTRS